MVSASAGCYVCRSSSGTGRERNEGGYIPNTRVWNTFAEMARDEQHHEEKLIEMIDEERLQYMGSVVLGLDDAL